MFVYEKENLDLIPLDLVGVQMQRKAAAAGGVNGGILRLVRVVHHTILAVLDVGVNFYIIIGAEPCSNSASSTTHCLLRQAMRPAAVA